jgi:hypothetical protein
VIETQRLHASTLIDLLHPQPSVNAMIEIVGLAKHTKPVNRYFQVADMAVACALELNGIGYNAFVGVNPRNQCTGFESSVPFVSDLFLDLQPERTPIEQVESYLTTIGLAPTVIADSGHGAHMHFKVQPAEPMRAKLVWERLVKFTGSDRVFNVNRIARLPGTINWKTEPKWCSMKSAVPERVYDVEYIDKRLNDIGAPPARTPKEGIVVPQNPREPVWKLRERIREQPGGGGVIDIIDTGEKNAWSEKQVTRSEADWLVICTLVRAGICDEDIHWLYESTNVKLLKYYDAGPRYLYRTIEAARRSTATPIERSARRASDAHRPSTGSYRENRRY